VTISTLNFSYRKLRPLLHGGGLGRPHGAHRNSCGHRSLATVPLWRHQAKLWHQLLLV